MNEIATCNQCGKRFCPLLEGVERNGMPFCSGACADELLIPESEVEIID